MRIFRPIAAAWSMFVLTAAHVTPGDSLLYTCPQCGGVFLLENLDFDKLKERSGAEWRDLFDARSASRSTALRGIFRFYELLAPA